MHDELFKIYYKKHEEWALWSTSEDEDEALELLYEVRDKFPNAMTRMTRTIENVMEER